MSNLEEEINVGFILIWIKGNSWRKYLTFLIKNEKFAFILLWLDTEKFVASQTPLGQTIFRSLPDILVHCENDYLVYDVIFLFILNYFFDNYKGKNT